jgi:hypothetical protein
MMGEGNPIGVGGKQMYMKSPLRALFRSRFVLTVCIFSCITVIMLLTMPTESQGGGKHKPEPKLDGIEMEHGLLKQSVERSHTLIEGTLATIGVQGEPGSYSGESILDVTNEDVVGQIAIMCYIPNERVQRVFELAFALDKRIQAWGSRISPPEGYEDSRYRVYEIVRAKIVDGAKLNAITFGPVEIY